jgi:serine/threonine protein kinase/tetratricopeptide (TPR) repeat protein
VRAVRSGGYQRDLLSCETPPWVGRMNEDLTARLKESLSDRYQIEGEIGAGGMATVYLATDLKHDRRVAVKVLRPELAGVVGADRFLNEIKVTAGLQHPHILTLHDSGETDSFLYYVMPYVEGESLGEKLKRDGPLSVPEAVGLLGEIADGLAYAHERGVVHRDIKPDNVLLSGHHALLADLGIAKAVSDTSERRELTTVGVIIGTPEYMAPEQATADPQVDHRADIYAFGILAYEMLTGRTPFGGRTGQEVLSAHVLEEPLPISEHRVGLPEDLDRLVMKCLEKAPSDRWGSAEDIVQALGQVARGEAATGTGKAGSRSRSRTGARWRRVVPATLGVAILTATGLWLFSTFTPGELHARSRIAVLPFENLSGAEEEYLSEGVTRDINTRIASIGGFVVIAHGSARQAKADNPSYQEMAEQLGVRYLVDGSVSREGDRVLITATLIDPQTDEQLWTSDYDRELTAEHIFTVRGEVARQVARALDVTLSPGQEAEPAAPTDNLQAYQEYLMGILALEERTVEGFQAAIQYFERAIELDSTYALAYAGLADVYLLRPWFSDQYSNREGLALADSMAERAIALDPTLPQPHATRGLIHEWQFEWEASEREFLRALELDPGYATARHWYGLMLARVGRHDEAIAEARASLELDPLSPIINQDVGYVLRLAGDGDGSIRQYERTLELRPDFPTTILVLAWTYMELGRFDDAADAFTRWAEVTGNDVEAVRNVAHLAARYATTGEPQMSTDLDLEAVFPPFALPALYVFWGQHERAFDLLEEGYEEGAFAVVSSILGTRLEKLRDHPRFIALAEKMGLSR